MRHDDSVGGWRVQPLACVEHGRQLQGLRSAQPAHPLAADSPAAVLAEFLIAAVCHGTNWDRLRGHILRSVAAEGLTATTAAGMTRDVFACRFGRAFTDADSVDLRHGLWVDAARAAIDGRVDLSAMLAGPIALGGDNGLFRILGHVQAYADDPQQKKSRVFAQQLLRHGLMSVSDPGEIKPAVEYHLIRLYLRTGRVAPVTQSALGSLVDDKPRRVDSLNALRAAVGEAMGYTADAAGLPLHELNDAEWQIARSFCTRERARCDGPALPSKPCDEALLSAGGGCPLAATCTARRSVAASWSEPQLARRYAFY